MMRSEMKEYKKCSDITEDECYCGGRNCGSCMYAWPGNAAIDLMKTDCDGTESNICRKCKVSDVM